MNTFLSVNDFLAITPILILLAGSIAMILTESFASISAKKVFGPLTIAFLITALISNWLAPVSTNPLLTDWLRFDSLATIFTTLFIITGIASTLLAMTFFKQFESSNGEYYFFLLAAILGLIFIGMSADFLTLFLGLETLSLALYVLCGYMKEWKLSHEAAMKYFLIGALAAALLLYGIALIYGAIGSTSFTLLLKHYQNITDPHQTTLFLSGIAFITAGIAFKAAVVPFHSWAPDVYDGAPTPVTAFMSVGTKIGAFAALAIIFLIALPQFHPLWNQGISILAYITMIYANIVALKQNHLRRFFAYSGISHSGFLLMAFVANTPDSIPALIFYLSIYSAATLGSFAVIAMLDKDSEGVTLKDLTGLFHTSPYLASLLILCLLTLAGLPPTAGFFAKFFLFKIAFQAGYYGLVIVGLLTTILSVFYYARIVAMMLSPSTEYCNKPQFSWSAITLGTTACAFILLITCLPSLLA